MKIPKIIRKSLFILSDSDQKRINEERHKLYNISNSCNTNDRRKDVINILISLKSLITDVYSLNLCVPDKVKMHMELLRELNISAETMFIVGNEISLTRDCYLSLEQLRRYLVSIYD